MLNIIIWILLLLLMLNLFFKQDRSLTYCGIFAFSGLKDLTQEQIDLALMKFKILGLYNQSRGVHGCGTYTDGQILRGVNNEKLFEKFIEVNTLPRPDRGGNTIMIGHCRQASRGAQTLANTHPFLINDDFVIVHNGTISNCYELNTKYGLSYKDWDVDSHQLGLVLEKGDYTILEKYEGYAALAFSRISDPNAMWVYHGASKEYNQGTVLEERPLFFMKEAEGIYFSSMRESLHAIREGESNIEILNHNNVFRVENGEFTGEAIAIQREEANIKIWNYNYKNYAASSYNDWKRDPKNEIGTNTPIKVSEQGATIGKVVPKYASMILSESLPLAATGEENKIYFQKGRWHMPDSGKLCNGCMFLLKKGIISNSNNLSTKHYWFINGVMLKDGNDYDMLSKMKDEPLSFFNDMGKNFAVFISEFAAHPVTCYVNESTKVEDFFRYSWYADKKRVNSNNNYTPKFGGRHYIFDDSGFLKEITASNKGRDIPILVSDISVDDVPNSNSTNNDKLKSADDMPWDHKKTFNLNKTHDLFDGLGVSFFDKIFENAEELMFLLTTIHEKALKAYIVDFIVKNRTLDVDDEELSDMLFVKIADACNKGVTLREIVDDKDRTLDVYYEQTQIDLLSKSKEAEDVNYEIVDMTKEEGGDKEEFEEAENIMMDVIDNMSDVLSQAERLTAIDHDFAQEVANKMYRNIDSLKHQLATICDDYKLPEMTRKLNNLNTKITAIL